MNPSIQIVAALPVALFPRDKGDAEQRKVDNGNAEPGDAEVKGGEVETGGVEVGPNGVK